MDSFYVYDNWTTDRARLHLGRCPNCNHGKGMMTRASSQHGRWHGPFYDRDEALAFAVALKRGELAACSKCRP